MKSPGKMVEAIVLKGYMPHWGPIFGKQRLMCGGAHAPKYV